jgi:predicted membrane protein
LLPKIINVSLSGIIVPAIVIAIGIIILIWVTTKKSWWGKEHFTFSNNWKEYDWTKYDHTKNGFDSKTTVDGNGRIKREYVFNGSKEKWNYGKLRNVEIEAVFSGVELDLSQTELADDVKVAVHIMVKSVFSGVILYVPDDWNIMVQKTGVFGGFVDNRPRNIKVDESKKVILELEAVFGGGEIRCYE